jgi:isocitrate dehydrogenase
LNLYGDILSDITAEMAGSIGLAGSANVGAGGAMFEAIHGTAPDIAGKNLANPSGLLNAAILMLHHIGQGTIGNRVQNALLKTLEDGIHTIDIKGAETKQVVGTREFADAVIARLGQRPAMLKGANAEAKPMNLPPVTLAPRPQKKDLVGVDIFLQWRERSQQGSPDVLAAVLRAVEPVNLKLSLITSRGVKVWPQGLAETQLTDHWRCRFVARDGDVITHKDIVNLLYQVTIAGLDFIKLETLCTFDDEPGYSLGQGQ